MTRHNWSHLEAGGTIVPCLRIERRRGNVGLILMLGALLIGLACVVLWVPRGML